MKKLYSYQGLIFQFTEGKQPKGAQEVHRAPERKAEKPKNKAAVKPKNKGV